MVIVSKGRTMLNGDSIEMAIDVITFMEAINEVKKKDYKQYEALESAIKAIIKEEELYTLDIIKEFALNMKEILS